MGGETKAELATAVYKVHVHCKQCADTIVTQFTQYPGAVSLTGVREVKLDGGKVTVKGIGFDAEKLRKKVEKGCRRRVELVPPPKDIVTELKSKKEELKIITVKVPLHCAECAVRVREVLLEHKSIYAAKADLGKNTCVIEGVIEEKKLLEYIYQRTRKYGIIEKVEKKEIIVEEKVEVKKKKEGETKKEEVKVVVKEKVKEVVAPYFIPCTHPHFIDYSHPELHGYKDTVFLHCSHYNQFLSNENPEACSMM
uniref:HMA domain-containing protein n=1 Tax=Leersia perrieri TaxID=77586 RepID=A0A0D9W8S7_9ORYZ